MKVLPDIEEYRVMAESAPQFYRGQFPLVILDEKEVKKLRGWLLDYQEMLFHNGKTSRIAAKEDIREANTVGAFLAEMNGGSEE